MPSSSDSAGLGEYWGDSGVASESWVWVESVEDDGSRSGVPVDALYVVSSVLRQSHGPWACDECSGNTKRCRGQFNIMQPDDETGGCILMTCTVILSWQFRLMQHGSIPWQFRLMQAERLERSNNSWVLTRDKKFLIGVVTDCNK